MSNHHNDSMSEQGGFQEISFKDGDTIEVDGGTTNVLLFTAAASGDQDIGGLLTHDHSGRKLRFMVRDDVNSSAAVRFLESGGVFFMPGSGVSVTLTVDQFADFTSRQGADGNLKWMLMGTNGTIGA